MSPELCFKICTVLILIIIGLGSLSFSLSIIVRLFIYFQYLIILGLVVIIVGYVTHDIIQNDYWIKFKRSLGR